MEKNNNITSIFEITVPKTAKTLAKFVSKDSQREMMKYICVDLDRGYITATDTHQLQKIDIKAEGEWAEGAQVLIDPKHIAKIAGKTAMVTVREEVREVEQTRTVSRGAFCGSHQVTEKVNITFSVVEVECDGETYTEAPKYHRGFPEVTRAIPPRDGRKAIRLTPESVEAVKTICKMHKGEDCIAMDIVEGDNFATIHKPQKCDGIALAASYRFELGSPAEVTTVVGFDPLLLANCLNSCDGAITFRGNGKQSTPIMFEGNGDTLLMPKIIDSETQKQIEEAGRNGTLAASDFSSDAAEVVAKLQAEAQRVWAYITSKRDNLTLGNYAAKDIKIEDYKSKLGYIPTIATLVDRDALTVKAGNVEVKTYCNHIFELLAKWESVVKCQKSVFKVGDVEKVTESVLEPEGGNVAEKKMKLRVLGGGWYADATRRVNDSQSSVYCRVNGRLIFIRELSFDLIDDPEKFAKWSEGKAEQTPDLIVENAATSPYFAKLAQILGIDATAPEVAEEAMNAKIEQRRAEAEEAERKRKIAEQERKEAEQRRKAELLADAKAKLLGHDYITPEGVEAIAASVGYDINIRTIGTMRQKLAMIKIGEKGDISWRYYTNRGATNRSFNGVFKVIRDLCEILKDKADEAAEQPSTPTETPLISTQAAEPTNVSADAEKREETENIGGTCIDVHGYIKSFGWHLLAYRHLPEVDTPEKRGNVAMVYHTRGIYYCAYAWINPNGDIIRSDRKKYKNLKSAMGYMAFTGADNAIRADIRYGVYRGVDNYPVYQLTQDELAYSMWLGNAEAYKTIAEKALTEAWTNIFLAAHRRGKGHLLVMDDRGELVDTVFATSAPTKPAANINLSPRPPKIAPQSTQPPQSTNYATDPPKARENANKPQISERCEFRPAHRRGLGAAGVSVLADAAATMAELYPPPLPRRGLSTHLVANNEFLN